MSPESVWLYVRECFETDDGSLPSVAFTDLEPVEVGNLYRIVRTGSTLVNPEVTFWDFEKGQDVELDMVTNAALLVAEKRAAGFAFAVSGLEVDQVRLPNLGVQIFESVFAIHYQMGPLWGPLQAYTFIRWLKGLLSATKHGRLDLTLDGPPAPESFMRAWEQIVVAS